MSKYLPLSALSVALAAAVATSIATQPEPSSKPGVKLNAPDTRERQAAFAELLRRAQQPRKEAIEQFIAVIQANPQNDDTQHYAPKALAMEALGKLKCEECIPVLVAEIEYRAAGVVDEDVLWAGMPAVGALIQIGYPSADYIVNNSQVLGNADEQTLLRLAMVVRYVFPNGEIARYFVQHYHQRDRGGAYGEKRDRLLELLKLSGTELLKKMEW